MHHLADAPLQHAGQLRVGRDARGGESRPGRDAVRGVAPDAVFVRAHVERDAEFRALRFSLCAKIADAPVTPSVEVIIIWLQEPSRRVASPARARASEAPGSRVASVRPRSVAAPGKAVPSGAA